MKKLAPVLCVILLGLLVFMYLSRDSGHDRILKRELQQLEETYADSIQSIRIEYDSIILSKDKEALAAFVVAQNAANRQEAEAVYWKNEAKRERNKNRVFTSVQTDSLLSLIPIDRP